MTMYMKHTHTTQSHWVAWNGSPVFGDLWTKLYQIKYKCAWEIAVCNAIFCLTNTLFSFRIRFTFCLHVNLVLYKLVLLPYLLPEIFAIKLQSCVKFGPNFDVFGLPNFFEEGPTNFWPNFVVNLAATNWVIVDDMQLGFWPWCGKEWQMQIAGETWE